MKTEAPLPETSSFKTSQSSEAANTPLLEVVDLRKYFRSRLRLTQRRADIVYSLDGVSFKIWEGETLGFAGESGCGKTTLARCIMRILKPTSGEVHFRTRTGQQVDLVTLSEKELRHIRCEIQMIFQNPYTSLNPRMTIMDIVAEPLLVHGVRNRRELAVRAAELLELVGLHQKYLGQFPHALSGGQRQRVVIARALAINPRLIVADEPVSALDASLRAQILNLLRDLQKQLGLTCLLVSHDLGVIHYCCDRIAVMHLGKIVELGPTESVFLSPKHPYTASLLAAMPEVAAGQSEPPIVLEGDPPNPATPPMGCHFHPRCPYTIDVCRSQAPSIMWPSPDHFVTCHRAEELQLHGIGS